MNWYIGQEIVCIKGHYTGAFKEGQTYTIKALRDSYCKCGHVVIHTGYIHPKPFVGICSICGFKRIAPAGPVFFPERFFAPLDQDISELTEILNQKQTA